MLFQLVCFSILSLSLALEGKISDSCIPQMDTIYERDFGRKVNSRQRERMRSAAEKKSQKLRVMTYNMLYNEASAELLLPEKYRWNNRKPRLLEYLLYSEADLIGSQELQEDQLQEVAEALNGKYLYYGEKTRTDEGRTDCNAIFFNPKRLELISAKTIPYGDRSGGNGFTLCKFRDLLSGRYFSIINTKLTWGDAEQRLAEATLLSRFAAEQPTCEPLLVIGDFNVFPFLEHRGNLFFDGTFIESILTEKSLDDAKTLSVFGHFGPLCSITNSRQTLAPFSGPEFPGFILDHIFVSNQVEVFTHGIDTARVEGEFPSDHFPVIADVSIAQ